MPWHHQYIGNPVLTWIFNLNKANKSNISDTHSGFRAFTREAYDKMRTDLKTTGMEFASEMLEVAIKNNLKIAEVPITYYSRPEGSAPNLSSFSDGWRHLKHISFEGTYSSISNTWIYFICIGNAVGAFDMGSF